MKVKINGALKNIKETISIEELLLSYKLNSALIIVELNNKVILKENFKDIYIKNNDSLELIRFMGGG